jgi:hypothetical protein
MARPRTRNDVRAKKGISWPAFFQALAKVPNVTAAARAAGCAPKTAYAHRNADPEFAAAWDDALRQSTDEMIGTAYKRAMRSSDVLMIFLLKCHRPEVYGDRQQTDLRLSAAPDFLAALDRAYGDEPPPEETPT